MKMSTNHLSIFRRIYTAAQIFSRYNSIKVRNFSAACIATAGGVRNGIGDRRATFRSAPFVSLFSRLSVTSAHLFVAMPLGRQSANYISPATTPRCQAEKNILTAALLPTAGGTIKKPLQQRQRRVKKIAVDNFFSESPIIPRSFLRAARYHDRYHASDDFGK